MKCIVISLFIVVNFLFISHGKTIVPDGLTNEEVAIGRVLGDDDIAYQLAKRYRTILQVKDHFRRAALLARCSKIANLAPNNYYLDPKIWIALNTVLDKMEAGKIIPITAERYRYERRSFIWAVRRSSEEDKSVFFSYLFSDSGRLTQQNLYVIGVFRMYSYFVVDEKRQTDLAIGPIFLKTYFEAAGKINLLTQAIQTVAPELVSDFKRVGPIGSHSLEDEAWLQKLNRALDRKFDAITTAYWDSLPKEELEQLDALTESNVYKLFTDAAAANSIPNYMRAAENISLSSPDFKNIKLHDRGNPRYKDFVLANLNQEFPEEQVLKMFNLSPREYVDNAHVPFCVQNEE